MSDIDIESIGYKPEDAISEDSNDGFYHFDQSLDRHSFKDSVRDSNDDSDECLDTYSVRTHSKSETITNQANNQNRIQFQEIRKTKIKEDCGYYIMGQCQFQGPFCWRQHRTVQERQNHPLPIVPSIEELNSKDCKKQNSNIANTNLLLQQKHLVLKQSKMYWDEINIRFTQNLIQPKKSIFQKSSIQSLENQMQLLSLKKFRKENKNLTILQKKQLMMETQRKQIRNMRQNDILQSKRMKLLDVHFKSQHDFSNKYEQDGDDGFHSKSSSGGGVNSDIQNCIINKEQQIELEK